MSVSTAKINRLLDDEWPASNVRCLEVTPVMALAKSTFGPSALRPGGYVSGPSQFAVADAALWFLVFGVLDRIEPMALTSELSIRYLRPALGDSVHARARLDRAGKRLVVGTIAVWTGDDEAKPTAVAQGTYTLPGSG
ncbi:MAG: PaaI family thioesterase [Myxococcota bacterium]